jgi:hypothetical protein
MARDDVSARPPARVTQPDVSLIGPADQFMLKSLADQLGNVPEGPGPITLELTTSGGDAELGRRAMLDIEIARERLAPRPFVFLGKTIVYSAGVTLMSGFPREDRFLTEDAVLLIHCRRLEQDLKLSGPLRSSLPLLKAKLQELETGVELEVEAFERLIAGSQLAMDELLEKALHNWYVPAGEAVKLGLVAGVV